MSKITKQLQSLAVSINQLNPDPQNARTHSEQNIEAIKTSLDKHGQRKPVVVQREGMIVRAGNGTVRAAKALGWDSIAAVVIDESNEDAIQFAIADNRTAELAEWQDDILQFELDRFPELQKMFEPAELDLEMGGELKKLQPPPTETVWLCALVTSEEDAHRWADEMQEDGCKTSVHVHRMDPNV
tara:strand:- start:98 stop:652 length:555 start_codon:yes stop_codon:yes gene_type:complete